MNSGKIFAAPMTASQAGGARLPMVSKVAVAVVARAHMGAALEPG